MNKFIRVLLTIAGLASCGAAEAQGVPAETGLDSAGKASLDALIQGAKSEGGFVYGDTIIQPTTNDLLTTAFLKYYGLPSSFQVRYTLLSSEAMITRIDQALSAGKTPFDLAAVGSPSWVYERFRDGDLLKYESSQYPAYTEAFSAGLGVDGSFVFNGGYAQIPIWNSEIIDFKGTSYKQALAAAPARRFSIGDAKQSASHLTTYAGLRQVLGVDFFKDMAAKHPTFIGRSELSAQRVVSGQDVIAFGGNPSRVLQADLKGAKLKILYPSEGFVFLPQSMFILKGAAHPNSAKLWTDFILSQQGQEILARNEALISGRTGFKSPFPDIAPSFDALRPKIIKVDWRAMTDEKLTQYRNEWLSIFNP
jgi:iron(III) transport system substrate-binding protein